MKYSLINYFKKNIRYIFLILIFVIITTICDLKLPEEIGNIIDIGIQKKDISYIYKIGLKMGIYTLIGLIANILVCFLSAKLSNKISYNIRDDLYKKILNTENSTVKNISNSSILNRLTNDVNQVNSSMFMILRIILIAPIIAFFAGIKIFNTNVKLSIILLMSIIVMFIIIIGMFILVFPSIKKLQILIDKISLLSRENINGIKNIKALNKKNYVLNKFNKINLETYNKNNYINKIMLLLTPLISFIINVTTLFIIYFSIDLVTHNIISIGKVISYIEYMIQIMSAFLMLSMLFIIIPKLSVSNARIKEVMNLKDNIINRGTKKVSKNSFEIEFKNVCFSYINNNLFNNINVKINNGDKIGIVGSISSGKTTFINLICRNYDVDSGKILINNIDIKEYDINNLRKNIGICLQNDSIYEGTIYSNLNYINKCDNNKLKNILHISKINSFVKINNIKKYKVTYDGKNLSGGEKRRLSIGVTLSKDCNCYIFDDPTKGIDNKTSNIIITNILKHLKDKTVILISDRIANLKYMDKIIVMDKGKIVGFDTHNNLIEKNKIYKQIYNSQKM